MLFGQNSQPDMSQCLQLYKVKQWDIFTFITRFKKMQNAMKKKDWIAWNIHQYTNSAPLFFS